MKKQIIGLVAVIFSLLFGTFVNAEEIRLTISWSPLPWPQAVVISWPGETGAIYRVMSSTNLTDWRTEVAAVATNRLTVAAIGCACYFRVQRVMPSLTVFKQAVFGNQTVVAGINNFLFGSFVVSAGSAEAINALSVTVTLSAEEAAAVTNMRLDDAITGATLDTVKNVPGTVNIYSISPNVVLAANGQKFISLFADVKPGANVDIWQAQVDVSGSGAVTGNSVSSTPAHQAMQTITIVESGTLTAALSWEFCSTVLLAGSTYNSVIGYKFSAALEGFVIDSLKLKAPNNFASSITSITISYLDKDAARHEARGAFVVGSESNAIATFTGLAIPVLIDERNGTNIYVDDARNRIDISIDIATIAQGAVSGASGGITLLTSEGFSATSDSGTAVTSLGLADLNGKYSYIIKKSKPSFAKLDAGTDPINGPLYRFSVVADNAGNIEIKQLSFSISAVGCEVTGLYLYDPNASMRLTDIPVDPWTTWNYGIAMLPVGTADDNDVLQVGTTPRIYEVRGTVTGYGQVGDSITVGFTQDTSLDSSSAYGMTCAGRNVWSDRLRSAHTVYTDDWYSGYLLKDMTQVQAFAP